MSLRGFLPRKSKACLNATQAPTDQQAHSEAVWGQQIPQFLFSPHNCIPIITNYKQKFKFSPLKPTISTKMLYSLLGLFKHKITLSPSFSSLRPSKPPVCPPPHLNPCVSKTIQSQLSLRTPTVLSLSRALICCFCMTLASHC